MWTVFSAYVSPVPSARALRVSPAQRFCHALLHLHVLCRLVTQRRPRWGPFELSQEIQKVRAARRGLFHNGHLVLVISLPVVEVVEVGDDDRDRKRNGQDTGDGAQRAHDFSPDRDGLHVPVAHRGHGHNSPPERVWDAGELRQGLVCLREVHRAGEQDDADDEEEDEQRQLSHARAQSVPQDLETLRVSRQFENPEHADESYYPQDSETHRMLPVSLLVSEVCAESYEVRQNRDDVYGVHRVFKEISFTGTREEAHDDLKREPNDAHRLNDEKGVVEWRKSIVRLRGVFTWAEEFFVVPEFWQCFQTKDDNGYDDDQHWHDRDPSGWTWTLRILEEQPDLAFELVLGQRLLLLLHEALILAKLEHRLFPEFIELDLFWKDVKRHVGGSLQATPWLIEVQNGVKARSIPVKEVFVTQRVEVPDSLLRVPQESVWELRESLQLGFKLQARHIDENSLAAAVLVVNISVFWLRTPVR